MQNNIAQNNPLLANNAHTNSVRMVKNERMAGFVPSYSTKAQDTGHISGFRSQEAPYDIALATEEKFSFKDFIDMINPLQHIPLVSIAYREITGDEIKPISKIVGGGVFGGPAGAAGSLLNVIVEEETGDDLAGNALSALGGKGKSHVKHDRSERQIYEDLPVSLLAFTEMPLPEVQKQKDPYENERFEMVQMENERTAGSMPRYFA